MSPGEGPCSRKDLEYNKTTKQNKTRNSTRTETFEFSLTYLRASYSKIVSSVVCPVYPKNKQRQRVRCHLVSQCVGKQCVKQIFTIPYTEFILNIYIYIYKSQRWGEGRRISQAVLLSVASVSVKFHSTLPIQTTPEQEKPAFCVRQLFLKTSRPDGSTSHSSS